MKLFDKIGQFIVNVLIVLIVIITFFSVYSFVVLNVMDKDYVSVFGYTYFEVVSGSMEPTIGVNDIIIVKLDSEYDVSDIVTYFIDGNFVTHRIVEKNYNMVITKGDNNNTRDKGVSIDSIIGRVCYIIPNGGVWKNVFVTPKVLITLVITLLLFSFTFSYNSKDKRRKIARKSRKSDVISDDDAPIKKGDDSIV